MKPVTKHYSNGEITVVWKSGLCQHSGICARGLPKVFDPRRQPWIELSHAETDRIRAQVEQCPSGALTWTSAPVSEHSEPVTGIEDPGGHEEEPG